MSLSGYRVTPLNAEASNALLSAAFFTDRAHAARQNALFLSAITQAGSQVPFSQAHFSQGGAMSAAEPLAVSHSVPPRTPIQRLS
jgi:hypothetical protein